jgi:hypothetical protein
MPEPILHTNAKIDIVDELGNLFNARIQQDNQRLQALLGGCQALNDLLRQIKDRIKTVEASPLPEGQETRPALAGLEQAANLIETHFNQLEHRAKLCEGGILARKDDLSLAGQVRTNLAQAKRRLEEAAAEKGLPMDQAHNVNRPEPLKKQRKRKEEASEQASETPEPQPPTGIEEE